MKQTHCEIMDLGNDAMGIACGVSDKCNHDSDGPLLYEDKDGNVYTREEVGHMSKEDAFAIISGYSTCSKCGKPFFPDYNTMADIEIYNVNENTPFKQ